MEKHANKKRDIKHIKDMTLHMKVLKMHADTMHPELDPAVQNIAIDAREDIGMIDKRNPFYLKNLNKDLKTQDVINYHEMIKKQRPRGMKLKTQINIQAINHPSERTMMDTYHPGKSRLHFNST